MQRRQITLEDGRYLIFYTFDEETAAASSSSSKEKAGGEESSAQGAGEPAAVPQATEERSV
jgi:hypothetical protein